MFKQSQLRNAILKDIVNMNMRYAMKTFRITASNLLMITRTLCTPSHIHSICADIPLGTMLDMLGMLLAAADSIPLALGREGIEGIPQSCMGGVLGTSLTFCDKFVLIIIGRGNQRLLRVDGLRRLVEEVSELR